MTNEKPSWNSAFIQWFEESSTDEKFALVICFVVIVILLSMFVVMPPLMAVQGMLKIQACTKQPTLNSVKT